MTERYDWDALAPYWHLFEARGSGSSLVEAVTRGGVKSPALYVGAGHGTYAAELARSADVVAVDASPAMAHRASELHPELQVVVADVLALPFGGGTFQAVVCATGVLELLGERRGDAYRELGRVAGRAPLYVAAFIDTGVEIDRHAAIAAWLSGQSADPLLDALAREVGDRVRAAELLERAMPRHADVVTEQEIVDAAGSAGRSTRRLLADRTHGVTIWRHD